MNIAKMILFFSICVIIFRCGTSLPLIYNGGENSTTNGSCNGPKFELASYNFTVYDIIENGFTFNSEYLPKIIAICCDVQSHFSIENNPDLELRFNRSRHAQCEIWLTAQRTIEAPFKSTFNITAQDKRTAEVAIAAVNIRIVETEFETFEEPIYFGEVTELMNVVILNGPIQLQDDDIKDYNIVISKEYRPFFTVQLSPTHEVTFILSEPETFPEFHKSINFTLIASNRHNRAKIAKTTITLDVPMKEQVMITRNVSLTSPSDDEKNIHVDEAEVTANTASTAINDTANEEEETVNIIPTTVPVDTTQLTSTSVIKSTESTVTVTLTPYSTKEPKIRDVDPFIIQLLKI